MSTGRIGRCPRKDPETVSMGRKINQVLEAPLRAFAVLEATLTRHQTDADGLLQAHMKDFWTLEFIWV